MHKFAKKIGTHISYWAWVRRAAAFRPVRVTWALPAGVTRRKWIICSERRPMGRRRRRHVTATDQSATRGASASCATRHLPAITSTRQPIKVTKVSQVSKVIRLTISIRRQCCAASKPSATFSISTILSTACRSIRPSPVPESGKFHFMLILC